jgi:hypothetical protein
MRPARTGEFVEDHQVGEGGRGHGTLDPGTATAGPSVRGREHAEDRERQARHGPGTCPSPAERANHVAKKPRGAHPGFPKTARMSAKIGRRSQSTGLVTDLPNLSSLDQNRKWVCNSSSRPLRVRSREISHAKAPDGLGLAFRMCNRMHGIRGSVRLASLYAKLGGGSCRGCHGPCRLARHGAASCSVAFPPRGRVRGQTAHSRGSAARVLHPG